MAHYVAILRTPLQSLNRTTIQRSHLSVQMNYYRYTITLSIWLVALTLLGLASGQARAAVYYVAGTGNNFNNGLSWSSPKSDLAATLHATVAGDQVWIEHGTYEGNFIQPAGVAVYGGFAGTENSIDQRDTAANPTTLQAGIYRVSVNGGPSTIITIDGLNFQNGAGIVRGPYDGALGQLLIGNCTFTMGSFGISEGSTSCAIHDCTFDSAINNGIAGQSTGAALNVIGAVTVTKCFFTNCSPPEQACMKVTGGATVISGCTFSKNSVDSISSETTTSCKISNCIFVDNAGGVAVAGATIVANCAFSDNKGGGVCASTGSNGQTGKVVIEGCKFSANSPYSVQIQRGQSGSCSLPLVILKDSLIVGAGTGPTDPNGIEIGSGATDVTVANNTIVSTHSGINITDGCTLKLANNLFYANYGSINAAANVAVTSSHNDSFANINFNYLGVNPSSTDLSVDPSLVDSANGNYHHMPGSPLINAGDAAYVTSGDADLDGHRRAHPGPVDVGCY
jgi:hypothetical protein